MDCRSCGKQLNEGSKFCKFCGVEQLFFQSSTIDTLREISTTGCVACGKELTVEAKFCKYCGASQSLNKVGSSNIPASEEIRLQERQNLKPPIGKSIPINESSSNAIIFGLIGVAVIVVAGYFFLNSKNSNNSQTFGSKINSGIQNNSSQSLPDEDGSWKIALASFGTSPEAKQRTIELSKELNSLNIIHTRPAVATEGYFMVVSDKIYTSKNKAQEAGRQLEEKFSRVGIRLDVNPKKSSQIRN